MKGFDEVKSILTKKYNVSRETFEKLEMYVSLLQKWQKTINLISPNTVNDIWHRHILDSLQLTKFINGGHILDVGSGAGFPGAVLAMATNADVICVDSDSRKCLFLKELFRQTETDAIVVNKRLRDFMQEDRAIEIVTARGFGKLIDLINIVYYYSCEGFFLKGKSYEEEILEAENQWRFHVEPYTSETDEEGKILKINGVRLAR